MDVEFDRSSGISSSSTGSGGMAMPRLHRVAFVDGCRFASSGVVPRGRACSGKHTLAAGHISLVDSRRGRRSARLMFVRRNNPETQSRRGFRAEMC